MVAGRSEAKLNQVVAEIQAFGGEAFAVVADVSKKAENIRLVEATVKKYGGLHIAFNNAGVAGGGKPLQDQEEKVTEDLISINAKGNALSSD